jgi:formylglycine-generating enzyme required for sulfatase activity
LKLAGALLFVASLASPLEAGVTRRPERVEHVWAGLSQPASDHAPAEGVVVLRPPQERRVRISGGTFVMGSTGKEINAAVLLCKKEPLANACGGPAEGDDQHVDSTPIYRFLYSEKLAHEVTLSDFDLDATEVTVRRYGRCVTVGACAPPRFPAGDPRFDQPEFPVTHVTWDEAAGFCRWVSGRLPTEAEWEHAARGRAGRVFPWGDLYNAHLANHGSLSSADATDARDGFVGLAPVGSFPDGATATGLLDMAGNVAEWVFDYYDRDDSNQGYRGRAEINPKGPAFSQYGHGVRGGSYLTAAYSLRTAARFAPSGAERDVGFRCAYDPRVEP